RGPHGTPWALPPAAGATRFGLSSVVTHVRPVTLPPGRARVETNGARLAPGYRADIVFLDLASIGYAPLNDVLLQLAVTLSTDSWLRFPSVSHIRGDDSPPRATGAPRETRAERGNR